MIKVKEIFNKYVTPLINIPYEICVFNRRIKQQHETFDQFLKEIRRLGNICELENITADEILRDSLLLGLRDENLRKRLLKDNKLTLKSLINNVHLDETAEEQDYSMRIKHEINYIKQRKPYKKSEQSHEKQANTKLLKCKFCGTEHV